MIHLYYYGYLFIIDLQILLCSLKIEYFGYCHAQQRRASCNIPSILATVALKMFTPIRFVNQAEHKSITMTNTVYIGIFWLILIWQKEEPKRENITASFAWKRESIIQPGLYCGRLRSSKQCLSWSNNIEPELSDFFVSSAPTY